MNYDPRFAAVCGDARLPLYRMARLTQPCSDTARFKASQDSYNFAHQAAQGSGSVIHDESVVARDAMETS